MIYLANACTACLSAPTAPDLEKRRQLIYQKVLHIFLENK